MSTVKGTGKRTVASIMRLAAWLKRSRRVVIDAEPLKVNLGSGLSVAEGWVNVDASLNALISTWPRSFLRQAYRFTDVKRWYSRDRFVEILKGNTFVHHHLEYGVPFGNDAVDYLYCSHMLEHLFLEDATFLLADMHRVLKRGGRVRLAVPNLEYAVGLYQAGHKQKALGYFFVSRQSERFERHQYMYDFDLLKSLLLSVNFHDIERCAFQTGKVPDIEKLDNRPGETLFVEATK